MATELSRTMGFVLTHNGRRIKLNGWQLLELRRLIANFNHERWGCVVGDITMQKEDGGLTLFQGDSLQPVRISLDRRQRRVRWLVRIAELLEGR